MELQLTEAFTSKFLMMNQMYNVSMSPQAVFC